MTKDEYCQYVLNAYKPAEAMLRMVPADKLDWKPGPTFMSLGQVVCHLCDGVGSALRMVIVGNWPSMEEMEQGMKLENLPSCGIEEGLQKLEQDKTILREALAEITPDDFANKVVSVPWGWQSKTEQMALDFREHFTNHKMQLFTYLKLLGLPVDTSTLYSI